MLIKEPSGRSEDWDAGDSSASMRLTFCWKLLFCSTHSTTTYRTTSRKFQSSVQMKNARLIDVEQYIKDTIEAVDPSFQLTVSENHRKGMMSALLGISVVEMDEGLRNLSTSIRWSKAESFIKEELSRVESPEGAPQFQDGLEAYEKFAPNASKLFSYLSSGREYKGKFDKLLHDVRPDLSPNFQEIMDPISDLDLLEQYARQQDPAHQDLLLQCVKLEVPHDSPDSSDSGKRKGKQGEASLKELLCDEYGEAVVFDNTFITTKHRNAFSKKCPYLIQLHKSIDLVGMTTELDAIVLAPFHSGDEMVTISEVWEAKATLNPVTFYDALSKKYSAISTIFTRDDAKLYIKGEEYSIQSTSLPVIGVYGSKILSPRSAARRTQLVTCEMMLSTSPQTVKEALDTGKVSVSHEKLMATLNATLKLAQEIKPRVYASTVGFQD